MVKSNNQTAADAETDEIFIEKLKRVPRYLEALLPTQRRILDAVLELKLPLSIFFITIDPAQLSDIDLLHQSLQDDIRRQHLLLNIGPNSSHKPSTNRNRFGSIDQVFTYKIEILKAIDTIKSIMTFYYLTDLPDSFTEHFSIEQIVRYGAIIDLVQRSAQVEADFKQAQSINAAADYVHCQKICAANLEEIKKLLLQFISSMDIHEVY